ncbi:hypothetical protein VDGL01_07297 [Verticillium dahliae]
MPSTPTYPHVCHSTHSKTLRLTSSFFAFSCRGEQAATALEANLAKLESRLDELLAGFETDELRNASSGGKGPAEK